MEFKNTVPSQHDSTYHSSGGGIYPSVPPPYPGKPVQHIPPPVGSQFVMGPSVGTTVSPAFIIAPAMGSKPCKVTCNACHQEIITRIHSKATMRTHLMVLLLFAIGCWPCACLPYFMDSCLNIDHYCPQCNAYIGTYQN